MCKALRDEPEPILHTVLHHIAAHWFASTRSKEKIPILQLPGMHRVMANTFEITFVLNAS